MLLSHSTLKIKNSFVQLIIFIINRNYPLTLYVKRDNIKKRKNSAKVAALAELMNTLQISTISNNTLIYVGIKDIKL